MAARVFQRFAYVLLTILRFSKASPLLSHDVEDLALTSDHSWSERRQNDNATFAVTGIQGAGVQSRSEIRDLEKDTDSWNLYMLGMQRFQATHQSGKFSYYRICGIHGRPYEAWDGVQSTGISQAGYCTHDSNIFLTWHRPYLALYEQILFKHVYDAANSFPTGAVRQRYRAAARRWRMPYWDWAAVPEDGSSVYPESITAPTITVTLPNGTTTIRNPLLSYRFHPVSEKDFYYNPYGSWPETLRKPDNMSLNAVSQNTFISSVLDNNRNSLMNRLFNLFANYRNYTQFSTEAWMTRDFSNADSLESIHDFIHAATGGNGHMTYFDFSAFDPLFFLHHTMMDRCLSLWQALNNHTGRVEPRAASGDTFMIKEGDIIDADSPLAPFHMDDSGKMFTSNDVMETDRFGYTYPELSGNPRRSEVIAKIRDLYGSNAVSGGSVKRWPQAQRVSQAATMQEVKAAAGEILPNGRLQHYVANIVSQKFALNGSYAIYVFLGDVQSEDAATWPLAANLAGTHAVLTGYGPASRVTNKRSTGHTSTKVTGSLPLTDGLLSKVHAGDLSGMSNQAVQAYLQKKLSWRIALMDGTAVDADDVADLEVTVVSTQVRPSAKEDEFPSWHEFTELKSATHGRPGGHRGG